MNNVTDDDFDYEAFKEVAAKDIQEAIEKLNEDEILFETQFDFLYDNVMRDKHFHFLKKLLKENGYENADKLHSSSFEVPEMGWMHAVYIMEEKIPTIEVLKTKVLEYFKNHKI